MHPPFTSSWGKTTTCPFRGCAGTLAHLSHTLWLWGVSAVPQTHQTGENAATQRPPCDTGAWLCVIPGLQDGHIPQIREVLNVPCVAELVFQRLCRPKPTHRGVPWLMTAHLAWEMCCAGGSCALSAPLSSPQRAGRLGSLWPNAPGWG